jgi:hypothetical protein
MFNDETKNEFTVQRCIAQRDAAVARGDEQFDVCIQNDEMPEVLIAMKREGSSLRRSRQFYDGQKLTFSVDWSNIVLRFGSHDILTISYTGKNFIELPASRDDVTRAITSAFDIPNLEVAAIKVMINEIYNHIAIFIPNKKALVHLINWIIASSQANVEVFFV